MGKNRVWSALSALVNSEDALPSVAMNVAALRFHRKVFEIAETAVRDLRHAEEKTASAAALFGIVPFSRAMQHLLHENGFDAWVTLTLGHLGFSIQDDSRRQETHHWLIAKAEAFALEIMQRQQECLGETTFTLTGMLSKTVELCKTRVEATALAMTQLDYKFRDQYQSSETSTYLIGSFFAATIIRQAREIQSEVHTELEQINTEEVNLNVGAGVLITLGLLAAFGILHFGEDLNAAEARLFEKMRTALDGDEARATQAFSIIQRCFTESEQKLNWFLEQPEDFASQSLDTGERLGTQLAAALRSSLASAGLHEVR